MNYYAFHLGDYASATGHLTWDEDMAYRRLLDAYYQRETPLPDDVRQVYRLTRAQTDSQRQAIDTVLSEFFTMTDDGWRHFRCDAEIQAISGKREKASQSAKARWRKAKAEQTQCDRNANAPEKSCERIESECEGNAPNPNPNPNPNHKDQKPPSSAPTKTAKKTKIPDPFMLTAEMRAWAAESAPVVNVKTETESFVDYWRGEAKTKADWPATWRNWIRRAQQSAEKGGGRGGYKPFNKQAAVEENNRRVVEEIAAREAARIAGQPAFDLGEPVTIEGDVIHVG